MVDLQGSKLAGREFIQWAENGNLHVTIDYNFPNGRRIEEKTSLRQNLPLTQQEWPWIESENGETLRRFDVDFKSGKATAEKRTGNQVKHRSEGIKFEPDRTFAGIAFVLAVEREREHLVNGEKIKLQAIGFTPKPRVVSAEISYRGFTRNEAYKTEAC